VGSGDARVLGELIDVAVWGAEVHPGVAAVVDPGLIEDLHAADRNSAVASWTSLTRNPVTVQGGSQVTERQAE
jgi:hypothetical protein